jgi:hypothetical protein
VINIDTHEFMLPCMKLAPKESLECRSKFCLPLGAALHIGLFEFVQCRRVGMMPAGWHLFVGIAELNET